MIDGLINIEEIRYKTILFTFFKRQHSYKMNIGCTVFAIHFPVFVAMKYGQPSFVSNINHQQV